MLNQFSRTELLLGKEAMEKLGHSRVAVFGVGGVGGYVCEALVRSGVGAFDLIDDDKVCLTNLNRQIIATRKTVGKYKAEVMRDRILEINPEAAGLIAANARTFAVSNIKVIEGSAPEILKDLPAPDCVFIGGSKGRLEEILELIRKKNPQARVVLNAISLETLAQTLEYCRKYPIKNDEIVQVNIAKSKVVGSYHMMTGQNPIYVVSFELD